MSKPSIIDEGDKFRLEIGGKEYSLPPHPTAIKVTKGKNPEYPKLVIEYDASPERKKPF